MRIFPSTLLLTLFLTAFINLHAQQPILRLAGKDSGTVSLARLKTEVKVIGSYAVTTMEMEFCNSTNRVLEGELIFPMPDGVTVSRYAIDINGKMREAVPVEKEKGQVVFENIVRRNVDPGLLEKVEGNNFRTRIYPIPANGCRTVLIGYEQLLTLNSKYAFVYSLPLHFKEPIKQFDFSITVASGYIPEVGSDCNTGLKFEELNKVFTSSVSKQHFMPDGAFIINVPKTPDAAEISMQSVNGRYYFLLNTFPQPKTIEKKIPANISVVWDASLSGEKRDHTKEYELLDAYIKKKGNLVINLFTTDVDFKKAGIYSISNGDWSELKKALENTVYDGATDLSKINFSSAGEEFIVFTDGISNWGNVENIVLPKKPVYTVCAAATANYSLLKYISSSTGGAFINLNESDIATAQKYLTEQTLQFIGFKQPGGITEVYPSVATPVVNGCSIAGISNSGNVGIFLQYGYGNTVVQEDYLDMSFSAHNTKFIDIEKIWAQKKIAELDIQYEKNKEAINALGKKYSVITRNTSLIVLDAVEDYVRYDIEPPAELMEAYTKLLNERKAVVAEKEKDVLADAKRYFGIVQSWWGKEFKPGSGRKDTKSPLKPQRNLAPAYNPAVSDSIPVRTVRRSLRPGESVDSVLNRDRSMAPATARRYEVAGSVSAVTADTMQFASGLTNYIASDPGDTDGDGVSDNEDRCINEAGPVSNFGCPVIAAQMISRVNLASQNVYFSSGSANLEEVSDRRGFAFTTSKSRGKRLKKALPGTRSTAQAASPVPPPPPPVVDEAVKEKSNQRTAYKWSDANAAAEIKMSELIPENFYLRSLDSVSAKNRYNKYLELRKDTCGPTFYFDVANLFFRNGDSLNGFKILSNIAELNLDDHESCKMLGYRLKSLQRFDDEIMIFRKVMQLRPQDPQSYRDFALALADAGKYQQALDTLYYSFTKQYDRQIKSLYPGIEEIILTEINELIALHGKQLNTSKIPAELIESMPVDVRVVISWNMNDTDVDLWVIDPNGEKCFFSHKETAIGGRLSLDFTRGYGPEQFMLKNSIKGTYKVIANYYGDRRQRIAGSTSVIAEVFTHYGTTSEQRKLAALQMAGKGSKEVLIAEFNF